jgi:hypothetical protein
MTRYVNVVITGIEKDHCFWNTRANDTGLIVDVHGHGHGVFILATPSKGK